MITRLILALLNIISKKSYPVSWPPLMMKIIISHSEFATKLGANNQLDVKMLLVKYKDIILLFQDLYKFDMFKEANFVPKRLIDCKKTIWGVSQLYLYSCLY